MERTTAEIVRLLESEATDQLKSMQKAEIELKEVKRRRKYLSSLFVCFRLARAIRLIVNRTIVWREGAILIGVTAIAGACYALSRSPLFGAVAAFAALGLMVFLVSYPSNATVQANLLNIGSQLDALRIQVPEITERQKVLKALRRTTSDKLDETRFQLEQEYLLASQEHRRIELSEVNWKAMRAVEFEEFLERVFIELGYHVEKTKVTGDQGVDLVVIHRNKRIAIQVKGYVNSVSGGAIQEAYTGMACYDCNSCAVITNRALPGNRGVGLKKRTC